MESPIGKPASSPAMRINSFLASVCRLPVRAFPPIRETGVSLI